MADELVEQIESQETVPEVVNPTGDYGFPNEFHIYLMCADWQQAFRHISSHGIGPHYLVHSDGRHLLACVEDLPMDGSNILEKIR